MTYVQGFLIPVPDAKRGAYLEMAEAAAPFFQEFGAERIVETWGDDIPDGKQTDFKRAVQAKDENVVFSWIEYPDRATCDAAAAKMQSDERMKMPDDMPFDGKRMIYAGFETILDTAPDAPAPGYVDGFVAAVPTAKKSAYLDHAKAIDALFEDKGATRSVENWGADVPDGKVTDFKRAVQAQDDETIVFSWIEWPDKPTRDAAMKSLQDDAAMQGMDMPFDGKRMIFGGFVPVMDTAKQE